MSEIREKGAVVLVVTYDEFKSFEKTDIDEM